MNELVEKKNVICILSIWKTQQIPKWFMAISQIYVQNKVLKICSDKLMKTPRIHIFSSVNLRSCLYLAAIWWAGLYRNAYTIRISKVKKNYLWYKRHKLRRIEDSSWILIRWYSFDAACTRNNNQTIRLSFCVVFK